MSNVEAPGAHTLLPSEHRPFRPRETASSAALAAKWNMRRRLFTAGLVAGDIVAGAVAIIVAATIASMAEPADQIGLVERLRTRMPSTLPLLVGTCCLLGVYRSSTQGLMERFRLRATAMVLFVFAGILMWAREGRPADPAIMPLIGAIALVLGTWMEHLLNARLGRSGTKGTPTAILGVGTNSRTFARFLMSQPGWGLRPVGFIDDGAREGADVDGASYEKTEDDAVSALPLLGTIEGWRADSEAEVVVVPGGQALPRDTNALYRLGVRQIVVVNQVGELASFGLQIRHFDRFVALELGGRPHNPSHGQKRAIDLAVALPLAVLAAPIIGLLALTIKFVDAGPAFYGQRRVGRDGKPIWVLKLRTMYRDAEQRLEHVLASDAVMREQWRRYFKLPQDPRVLPHVGNFLRRTSLDELPQLWNVIRGDMSLVGPRPFPAYHMEAFDPEFQALRVTVPPGLTGLWQISSRSDGDLGVQRAQDCFYIRNRSLWLDLYILIATLPAVIGGQGAK